MRKNKLSWRINEEIRATNVRVIGSDGKQLGLMSRGEALDKSRGVNLDLVEIAPLAHPPVVKIVDIGKFKYQEEKKLRKQGKKERTAELKEIRFSPFIAENDFNTRFERIKEFLTEKNKVKATVVFKRDQMIGSKQFGYDLLNKMLTDLGDSVTLDMKPKFLGRHLSMIISPVKNKISKIENKDAETKN